MSGPHPAMTLSGIVKALNAHQFNTGSGFYAAGGRYFGARVQCGELQVTEGTAKVGADVVWRTLDAQAVTFRDHNGRNLFPVQS